MSLGLTIRSASVFNSVVFPDPLPPMMAVKVPGASEAPTECRSVLLPELYAPEVVNSFNSCGYVAGSSHDGEGVDDDLEIADLDVDGLHIVERERGVVSEGMTRLGIVGSGGVGGRGDGARAIGLIDLVAAEGPRALRGSWGLHGEVGDVGAGSPGAI